MTTKKTYMHATKSHVNDFKLKLTLSRRCRQSPAEAKKMIVDKNTYHPNTGDGQ
jgi:hypothetical protein